MHINKRQKIAITIMTNDIDEVSVVSQSLHRSTVATDETNRKRSSHMNHQHLLESSLASNISTRSKPIAAKIPTNEGNTTIITTASQRYGEDDNHDFVRSPDGDGFWYNNKFYSTDGIIRDSCNGSASATITAGTFKTISASKHQDDTASSVGMMEDDECVVAIATTASEANGDDTTSTMTTPSKTNKRKRIGTTPVKKKLWKKEAGKPKHPLHAYNLFFYIYRQRLAESISGNKHNDKEYIDSRFLQSPSTIISEDDINFYFGPTDEDCCDDEIIKARPKRNINMSFTVMAQKVSVAWRTIDTSSKNNLQQRAKWNQLQYCLKLSRWQEMKQIAAETPTNFVNLNAQWDASASRGSTSTGNAFYAEMHDPTTSSSTTPKTKHTAHNQKCIPSNAKYTSMVADVARTDLFQFTKTPLDMSSSVLFDESKIENEFDDELSFKSSGTSNTNVTFQNTKVPATIRLAGSGPLDPQLDRTDRHHYKDTDTLCFTATRLRHVTPEPMHKPEMCAQDFQQNIRSFVPTKRMEPSLMEQQQAFRHVDNTGTLHASLDNCYVPSNEGQRQDAGNIFRHNVTGQRIIPTNQRMNHFECNAASRSRGGIFQSMIVPPTPISTRANRELGEAHGNHSHSASSTIDPIGAQSLSSHRYHTLPIQSLVEHSLALSCVCLTKSLVKMDDAISSFYTAFLNHEQLYNTTGRPNNHYTNQRADVPSNPSSNPSQSEIYPCTSCSCMAREHGRYGLDDLNPHRSSRTNLSYNWSASSRQVPNEDAMNFAKSDGHTESNDGQDPHLFEM